MKTIIFLFVSFICFTLYFSTSERVEDARWSKYDIHIYEVWEKDGRQIIGDIKSSNWRDFVNKCIPV